MFRVAPPGVKYNVPKVKFDTIEDNIEALKSPNLATRYIAWTNLHKEGAKAEAALLKLYESKVPHERARALWLLGRIEGKGKHYVDIALALKEKDPNIRVVAIRLARQLKLDIEPVAGAARSDHHPAVRREGLIALRHQRFPDAPRLWAILAADYDGKDRWYLEAIGIGADNNWDEYMKGFYNLSRGIHPDIGWRSRATKTPDWLAFTINNKRTPAEELPKFFRAFDFQKDSDIKTEALVKLAFSNYEDPARAKLITTEAISRLKNFDVAKNAKHAAALDKVLDGAKGTTSFVEMVGKFNVAKRFPDLLVIAQKAPSEQLGVDAIRVLLDRDQIKLIQGGLESKDSAQAARTAQAIAGAGHDKAAKLLMPIVLDAKQDLELRRQATRAVARTKAGAVQLIKLAQEKKLSDELHIAAGSVLAASTVKEIREDAAKLFPQPQAKDKKPVPAISELVKFKGNAGNGLALFMKQAKCADCHQVNGAGKAVGPDLSEIGKKLSREAVFESILFPSASISHNFETYIVETKKGTTANGVLISKTPAEVSIKDVDALVRTFKTVEVESVTRSPVSLMPADLHQLMSTPELVDLVEYMLTLRDAKK